MLRKTPCPFLKTGSGHIEAISGLLLTVCSEAGEVCVCVETTKASRMHGSELEKPKQALRHTGAVTFNTPQLGLLSFVWANYRFKPVL